MDAFLSTKLFMLKQKAKNLFKEESGETNIIAIILVIIVVIALVAVFRKQLGDLVNGIFEKIFGELGVNSNNYSIDGEFDLGN